MRSLAEFIMRGRTQASLVALLCFPLPLLSPAAVALVTLRRGLKDGATIAGWALLPAIVLAGLNAEFMSTAFITLSGLVALLGGAWLLNSGAGWATSLFGLLVIVATGGWVFALTFDDFLAQVVSDLNAEQQKVVEAAEGPTPEVVPFTVTMVTGLLAMALGVNSLLALVLGRWWQALLYNPGGFREEFHQLRLSKTQSLIGFGVAAVCVTQTNWVLWGYLAALPLLVTSAAIVHNRVFARSMGLPWLVLFYLLAFIPPIIWLTLLVGFTDAWVDYRRRFGSPPAPPANNT